MRKPYALAALMLVAVSMLAYPCASRAEEGGAAPPAAASKLDSAKGADAAKEEGGDKEGGDKKKSTDVMGGRFAGDPIYVRLQPIVLPILGNTGPEQLVTVQITVEMKDFDSADDMHSHMPRVMDALIQALYGGLSSGDLRDGRLADASKIKGKAMTALQKVEGPDSIKDILIVNLSQRLL